MSEKFYSVCKGYWDPWGAVAHAGKREVADAVLGSA